MIWLAVILAGAFACDLAWAWIHPLKTHRLCAGRGTDVWCKRSGKVPRFGARWVRRDIWREYWHGQ